MFGISGSVMRPLAVLGGLLLSAAPLLGQVKQAVAQSDRGNVTKMEIYEGGRVTVRYFGKNLSPGEAVTVRELERLENEQSYLRDLQVLKTQYAASERLLEPIRREVQMQLYGTSTTRSASGTSYVSSYGNGAAGYYGYPYLNGGGPLASATLSDSVTQTRSLAEGVGPQGVVKDAMAGVLASQSTAEYAAAVDRAYDRVAMRAASSSVLAAAFGLKKGDGEVAAQARYTVTLKDGRRITGQKMAVSADDKEMWVVERSNGSKSTIRKSDVVEIDDAGPGVKPAG